MKNFRRQVFRFGAVRYPLDRIGVDTLEVQLIEVGEAGGILLGSFDQKPLVRFFLQSLHFPTFKKLSAVLPYVG